MARERRRCACGRFLSWWHPPDDTCDDCYERWRLEREAEEQRKRQSERIASELQAMDREWSAFTRRMAAVAGGQQD
jgi:hypothetical protein